jgi:hypothetical protein
MKTPIAILGERPGGESKMKLRKEKMRRRPVRSDLWARSPLTVYLELAAMTLAGLLFLSWPNGFYEGSAIERVHYNTLLTL